MDDRRDVLVWLAFLQKRNFAEAKGLVIRNGIEYSFEKHLGREREMEVSLPTFYRIYCRDVSLSVPLATSIIFLTGTLLVL
jgi:hypothetical protein